MSYDAKAQGLAMPLLRLWEICRRSRTRRPWLPAASCRSVLNRKEAETAMRELAGTRVLATRKAGLGGGHR